MSSISYLNGVFMPVSEARISPLDRGFIFGDGIYEVIPAYGGKLFRLDEHLRRLANNLTAVKMKPPLATEAWKQVLNEIVLRNLPIHGSEQSIYLQVTRGVAERDHGFPDSHVEPTLFIMSTPLKALPESIAREGVAAITHEDIRWKNCHIKCTSLLGNILLRQQAYDEHAVEAILIRDGEVTEGAASNLFALIDGILITPPKGPLLLPGITRDLILELAQQHNIPSCEAFITPAQLKDAEEIWLTSSTKEILPVTTLDGVAVHNGKPGKVWQQMTQHYQQYKQQLRNA